MNIDTQALLEELGILYARIKDGSAQLGDLEAFAAATAHLHEKAIVLRYKAYEQKVFGTHNEAPAPAPVEQVAEEVVTTQAAIESNEPDITIPIPADPEPVKESEPEEFDLFSLNDEEENEEPVFEPFSEEEEPAAIEEPAIPDDMPDFDEPENTGVTPEPEVPETSGPEIIQEQVEETQFDAPAEPVAEAAPEPEPARPVHQEVPSGNVHPLYNRLQAGDDSLAARLLSVKLDTLNGAFGFNERLQMVQELFHGNTEKFNEALNKLDNLSSKNESRSLVTTYANQYNWSSSSDLVLEFVRKVERRYA